MAREDEVKRGLPGNQGGQEKVNVSRDDKPGYQQMAGENIKFTQENDEQDNVQQGGMQSGRGGRQAGQAEVSGAGQKGNEKDRQLQTESERGDTENEKDDAQQSTDNEDYDESELRPGGTGKQGDQQQFTQDREHRKDKSRNSGDSDKQHGP